MRKRASVSLPQKRLKNKLVFDKPIICELNVAMAGKESDKLTDSEKERFTTQQCVHPMWPPFMPQCKACALANNPTRRLVDKKGREYRDVTPAKPEKNS